MAKVDLSKTLKVVITPGKNGLGLVFEKACRSCALKYSRKSGTYSSIEEMKHCGDCATNIRRNYETGNPFEIEIPTTEIPADYLKDKTQKTPEARYKPISTIPNGMFLAQRH